MGLSLPQKNSSTVEDAISTWQAYDVDIETPIYHPVQQLDVHSMKIT